MFHPITTSDFSIFEVLKIIFIGALADSFTIILASSLMAIYLLFISNNKYHKPYGYIIFGVLVILMLYTKFVPNNIFAQYGGSVQEIALTFLGIKTLCFGIMLFLQKQRRNIRNILYFSTIFIYSLSIIFNSVSEYFFWNEFGIRYNFIAVDYLIYTKVFREITESTNNFQHKPAIYAFEAKYYLQVERDYKRCEQSYNKAIEFARMLNDETLVNNLLKEKETDLVT